MRVLVTNDDGISAAGLRPLVEALADAGHEVVVSAPARNVSGASAAIGRIDPGTKISTTANDAFAGVAVSAHAVDGPPGVAVLAGILGAYGEPPQAVVSGINAGANTGNAVLHSGTVGAVLTARNFGVSGLAVSLEEREPWHWETAAALAVQVLPSLPVEPAVALNLNCPAGPRDGVRGLRWATLARSGTVRAVAAGTHDGALEFTFGEPAMPESEASDVALLAGGFATVTLLSGIRGLAAAGVSVDADSVRQLAAALEGEHPELRPVRPAARASAGAAG